MRSKFGQKALSLRLEIGMTQKDFADAAGWSLSRVSNIEYDRAAISDDVLRIYLKLLKPNGKDADELRKLASFGNSVRTNEKAGVANPPLVAMLQQFGKSLSPVSVAKIQEIIERETGERVSELRFSSDKNRKRASVAQRKRPTLATQRFVEICILASRFRARFAGENHALKVGRLLDQLAEEDQRFDFRVAEVLPSHLDGAFACIIGEADGHVLLLEEARLASAMNGVHFARHVVAHEIGHHVLHTAELVSDGELIFQTQKLARNSSQTIGSEKPIQQVVDSVLEVEAECFATFLLVPWEAYIKGTEIHYLSKDYGEQKDEVARYKAFFSLDTVAEEFKRQLWQLGENSHPIFSQHSWNK